MVEEKKFLDLQISEDYFNADMYIKMAHKTTARTYWAHIAVVVAIVMTLVVLFNHYWSYEEVVLNKFNVYLRDDVGGNTNIDSVKIPISFGRISASELDVLIKKYCFCVNF